MPLPVVAKGDLYARLGIAPGASAAAIKQAYRRLAKKLHPDVNRDRAAHERFLAVKEAYEVLSNPLLRREYDERRIAVQPWDMPPRPGPAREVRVTPPFSAGERRGYRIRPAGDARHQRQLSVLYTATVAGSSVVFLAGAFLFVAFGGVVPGVLSFLMGISLVLLTLHYLPSARR